MISTNWWECFHFHWCCTVNGIKVKREAFKWCFPEIIERGCWYWPRLDLSFCTSCSHFHAIDVFLLDNYPEYKCAVSVCCKAHRRDKHLASDFHPKLKKDGELHHEASVPGEAPQSIVRWDLSSTPDREIDGWFYSRLKNNTHIVLSSLSLFSPHPIYPPQRIIDAIHAPEMLRRCDFLPLLLLCFSVLSSPPNPKRSRGTGGSPLKFFFPLRLSVTDWQKEHMTGVQMADKNKIRHVMRY